MNADVVVWSGNPFSIYSKADLVFIDGAVAYDRHGHSSQRPSDLELADPRRNLRGEPLARAVAPHASSVRGESIAITGVDVWTNTADAPVRNATIVISGGRIVSIQSAQPPPLRRTCSRPPAG